MKLKKLAEHYNEVMKKSEHMNPSLLTINNIFHFLISKN